MRLCSQQAIDNCFNNRQFNVSGSEDEDSELALLNDYGLLILSTLYGYTEVNGANQYCL